MKLENGETIAYIAILNILTHPPKPSSLKTQRVNSKSNPLHTSKYEHHFENLKIYTIEALSVFFVFVLHEPYGLYSIDRALYFSDEIQSVDSQNKNQIKQMLTNEDKAKYLLY